MSDVPVRFASKSDKMKRILLILCAALSGFQSLQAQQTTGKWTLQKCKRIDYAMEHNISSSAVANRNVYTGSYGIDAGLTIYSGGKLRNGAEQAEMQNRIVFGNVCIPISETALQPLFDYLSSRSIMPGL